MGGTTLWTERMLTVLKTGIEGGKCIPAKGYPPLPYRFWREQARTSQSAHTQKKNQFQKSVCIAVLRVTLLDSQARLA